MRLSKYLSNYALVSRRKADQIIKSGLVSVNGQIVFDPWVRISENDKVMIGKKIVKKNDKKIYIMLNKPEGVVCSSVAQNNNELTLTDIIKIKGTRIFPVGRLDKDSEGLLLLTNDGDFAYKITHPSFGITKTYTVHTDLPIPPEKIKQLEKGIRDRNDLLKAKKIIKKAENLYIFIMQEGKNREIRRLLKFIGLKVRKLRRSAIGKLRLDKQLSAGRWRFLLHKEIESLIYESNTRKM
ncbi:MAG TPA: pseudouridine synthase [Victivallales bacterium]|nr:pseudouridine synthase [Victivallales bacterium]HPO91317.1 pseudouridine synthase [Victivallales bacterium]